MSGSKLRVIFNCFFVLALALTFVAAYLSLGRIHGMFFPVAHATITNWQANNGKITVWLEIEKLKECPPAGLTWWQGKPYRSAYFTTTSAGIVKNLPVGNHEVGPFTLHATKDQILRSSLTLEHRCFAWFVTITDAELRPKWELIETAATKVEVE